VIAQTLPFALLSSDSSNSVVAVIATKYAAVKRRRSFVKSIVTRAAGT
jgi:hypothetical protein